MGIPVVTVANTMQTGAVMEGMHSIDVGILILPALVEMISYIADESGIDYVTGLEEGKEERISDATIQMAVKKLEDKQKNNNKDNVIEMPEPIEETEEPKEMGLMSRRML